MKKSTKLPFGLYLTTEDYAHKFAGAESALARQAAVLEEEIKIRVQAIQDLAQTIKENTDLKEENANLNFIYTGAVEQIEALLKSNAALTAQVEKAEKPSQPTVKAPAKVAGKRIRAGGKK